MIRARDIIHKIDESRFSDLDKEDMEDFLRETFERVAGELEITDLYLDIDDRGYDVLAVWFSSKENPRMRGLDTESARKCKKQLIEKLEQGNFLEESGWYIREEGVNMFSIEPIYPQEIEIVPRYLYHFTKRALVRNILDKGLIPSRVARNTERLTWHGYTYPPRLFFTAKIDTAGLRGAEFVLKIDTRKLSPKVNFYRDNFWAEQSTSPAFWTDSPIPPQAIKPVSRGWY